MKMSRALVAAAGVLMSTGAALAIPSVDPDDLLGAWDATVEGADGEATVRVLFAEDGTYLALAMIPSMDEPVPFWETGEWEVDDDTLVFEALASSEELVEDEKITEVTIVDLDDDTLDVTSEEDPMWDALDFARVRHPGVGVWRSETDEGTAIFLMAAGGGFAGGFGEEGDMEIFWGTWELGDDEITFAATNESWEAGVEPELEPLVAEVEDMGDNEMTLMMEGLSDDEIEWERQSSDPLVGEWLGEAEGEEFAVEINEDSTFTIVADMDGEESELSGIWTVTGPGLVFFAVTSGAGEPMVMHFVLTSPTTVMFGEGLDEMFEFERQ